jgi:hypothetical protein
MIAANTQRLDAQELKQQVDLRDFVRAHGLHGKAHRKDTMIQAPWHDEKTPSCAVYKDGFKHWATGQSGDVYEFVRLAGYAHDFQSALEYVNQWAGGLPAIQCQTREKDERPARICTNRADAPKQAKFKAFSAHAAEYLYSDAPDALAALDYLHKRGLTDETIRRAGLGFNHTAAKWRTAPGITIPWPMGELLPVVRIRRPVGALAQALGVPDEPDGDKYSHAPGSKPSLSIYNASDILGTPLIPGAPGMLTEGEFDALLAAQTLGGQYEILSRGSASAGLPADFASHFAGRDVYLPFDNDAAGKDGRDSIARSLIKAGARPWIVTMPSGAKDITDAVVSGLDLDTIISSAQPWTIVSGKVVQIDDSAPSLALAAKRDEPLAARNNVTIADVFRNAQPLPLAARSALLNIAEPCAPLLELIAQTGVSVHKPASIADFVRASDEAGAKLSAATIRRAIDWAVSAGIICTESLRDSRQEERITADESKGLCANNYPGRPATYYQLVAPDALRAAFKCLAEQPAVVRRFAHLGIVPAPRADVLATYAEISELEARPIVEQLRGKLKDKINQQPGYAEARLRAKKDVDRQVAAFTDISARRVPMNNYPTVRHYRLAVLRQFVAAHDGEQLSRSYLARVVNCSVRRVVDALESVGIASEPPAPVVQTMPAQAARAIAEHITRTGRPAYDFQVRGAPVAMTVGSVRIELTETGAATADKLLSRTTNPVTVEYRGADVRRVATDAMPAIPRRSHITAADAYLPAQPDDTLAEGAVAPQSGPPSAAPNGCRTERQFARAAVQIVESYLAMATSWRVEGSQGAHLIDTETGEMLPYTRRNVLSLLSGNPAPDVYEPSAEPLADHSGVRIAQPVTECGPQPVAAMCDGQQSVTAESLGAAAVPFLAYAEHWPQFGAIDRADDELVVSLFKRYGQAFKDAFEQWERDQSAKRRAERLAAQQAKPQPKTSPVPKLSSAQSTLPFIALTLPEYA